MDTLQVIAEPRRRRILQMIWDDEMAASDIAEHFEVSFGAVSQHLAILRSANLVDVRKDGTRRIYSVNKDAIAPYREVLETMWSETLSNLAHVIEESESG
jgi:DNA-binding transcriptional ArsR family regulator